VVVPGPAPAVVASGGGNVVVVVLGCGGAVVVVGGGGGEVVDGGGGGGGGEVVGGIQYHEEDDPMYRHAGMDIFLSTSHHGKGLGAEAIRVLARHLFEERGHHRLTIDPAADNEAAIRAYERVGFRRIGIMRKYERGPDGVWHDGLLMDMLAAEFRP